MPCVRRRITSDVAGDFARETRVGTRNVLEACCMHLRNYVAVKKPKDSSEANKRKHLIIEGSNSEQEMEKLLPDSGSRGCVLF